MLINPQITLQKSYLSFSKKDNKLSIKNIELLQQIIERLESNNIVISEILFENLLRLDYSLLEPIHKEILNKYSSIEGVYLYSTFATRQNLKKEHKKQKKSIENYARQMMVYFIRYELDMNSNIFLDYDKDKEIIKSDLDSQKFPKIKINMLSFKSIEYYKKELKQNIEIPVVFGNTQLEFISSSYKLEYSITMDILKEVNIKIKENLFSVLNILKTNDVYVLNLFQTITDIIRYAMFVTDNDYKNLNKNKYIQKYFFKTAQKKIILNSIEKLLKINYNLAIEEIDSPRNKLILRRMFANIRPLSSKYKKLLSTQKMYFEIMLHNKKINTFNKKLENLKKDSNYSGLIKLLSKRPGILLRNLDYIIRKSNKKEFAELIDILKSIKNPNIKMLLQTSKYIQSRNEITKERIINIKGKLYSSTKLLEPLKKSRISKIKETINFILMNHLKGKELLPKELTSKKIYIDERLKKYVVPTEMRDTSTYKNGNTLTPGTRIPIKDSRFLRLYTAWGINNKSNIEAFRGSYDLDLSTALIDDKNNIKTIGWNADKGNEYISFSGDIVDCDVWDKGNVAAEFIDIDIKKAKKKGIKYVISSNIIYDSGDYISDYDTDIIAISGIMSINKRVEKDSDIQRIKLENELFEMTLKGCYNAVIPYIFDIESNEIVIVDKYLKVDMGSSIYTHYSNIEILKRNYTEAYKYKENMYELLENYFKANNFEIIYTMPEQDIKNKEEDNIDILYLSYEDDKILETYNIAKNLETILTLLN
jgi:hypothetical protein